jgi:mono/diheme cytochrome c family protein
VAFWLIGSAGVVAALALFFHFERRPELSPVAQGKLLATANGCFACHGSSESDRRANFRRLASGGWKPKSIPTLWENGIDRADVLNEWITKGVTDKEAEDHKRLFIQMPAYAGFMTPAEIEAVSAWILSEGIRLSVGSASAATALSAVPAAQTAQLEPERLLMIGDRLSRRYGCYQCHGELGQGGVENPASFKTTIPGFFGREFRQLTDEGDRAEILHWIDHGRGREIETGLRGFLAKRFFDGQAIGMPGYRDQLNESEKNILTEYLMYLNKNGPLSAKELERILKLLNDEPLNKS